MIRSYDTWYQKAEIVVDIRKEILREAIENLGSHYRDVEIKIILPEVSQLSDKFVEIQNKYALNPYLGVLERARINLRATNEILNSKLYITGYDNRIEILCADEHNKIGSALHLDKHASVQWSDTTVLTAILSKIIQERSTCLYYLRQQGGNFDLFRELRQQKSISDHDH